MTSFQERFKGKTSTISKEGVIPSLDKPPISKGYIQKDPSYQDKSQGNFSANPQGTSNYSTNSNKNAGSSRGNQSTSSNQSSYSPISNPYVVQGQKNNSQQAKVYKSEGTVQNKQQQSNSNFSTRSEQSNNSKVSINQKIQQPQQSDPYFVNNPFDLNMISLNNVIGSSSKQQQQGYGQLSSNPSQQQYNSNKNIGYNSSQGSNQQANKSYDYTVNSTAAQHIQFNQGSMSNGLQNNITSDNSLASSKMKNQSQGSKVSAYTLEKNTKTPQNTTGQSNMTQGSNNNPYHNYNPYTLESIENIDQKSVANKGKNSSSPDIRRYNNRVLQQQQNNLQKQEEEASQYVQSYVPSFAQHVSSESNKQSQQQPQNGNGLNNSKPISVLDYPSTQVSRGGLGANTGTEEWNQKKDKQDKMLEYSAQVKYFNQQQQANLPPSNQRRPKQKEEDKKLSTREKALEFSKNIPKPRSKTEKNVTEESSNNNQGQSYNNQFNYKDESSPTSNANTNNNTNTLKSYNSGTNGYQNQYETDFEALERQHLEYLNKIEQLNMN